jgi:hypothetical protein
MLIEPTNTAFCCDIVGNSPLCGVDLDMINFAMTTSFLDIQLENQICGSSAPSVGGDKKTDASQRYTELGITNGHTTSYINTGAEREK